MPGIVVGILVAVAVAQFLHKLGGRIANGEGDRQIARFPYLGQRILKGHIGAVALG